MAAASRRTSRARPTYAYPPPDYAAAYSGNYDDEDTPFELDEADVWSNDVAARVPAFETIHDNGSAMPSSRRRPPGRADVSSDLKPLAAAAAAASSLPVNILDGSKSNPKWDHAGDGGGSVESDEEGDEEEDRESRVPPHEYLARRRGASLSVHEGIGRKLKGRDLSRVRDAIWKSVGFAD